MLLMRQPFPGVVVGPLLFSAAAPLSSLLNSHLLPERLARPWSLNPHPHPDPKSNAAAAYECLAHPVRRPFLDVLHRVLRPRLAQFPLAEGRNRT